MNDSHTPGGWFPGSYPMSKKHTELLSGAQSPPPGRRFASSPSPPPNRRNKYKKYFKCKHTFHVCFNPLRKSSSPTKSPKKRNPQTEQNHTTKIDPKLGAPRKTAGVRNLPKIEKGGKKKEKTRRDSGRPGPGVGDSDASSNSGDTVASSRKSAGSSVKDLDTVEEEAGDN